MRNFTQNSQQVQVANASSVLFCFILLLKGENGDPGLIGMGPRGVPGPPGIRPSWPPGP